MIYLILTIFCSAMISIVMRLAQDRVKGRTYLLSVNYGICMVLSGIATGVQNIVSTGEGAFVALSLGVINGIFFFLSLILNQKAIAVSGIVLPSIISKLGGLLMPFALSVALFGEDPKLLQILGAVISVGAIVLINYNKNEKTKNSSVGLLLALLLVEGFASSGSKVFGEIGKESFSDNFLFWTFGAALIISVAVAMRKKEQFDLSTLIYGAMIGIPNFFGARFTLMALQEIPAVIVYPVRSVGSIMVITLFGVFFFKEKLRKNQWVAMAAIMVALVLLNV